MHSFVLTFIISISLNDYRWGTCNKFCVMFFYPYLQKSWRKGKVSILPTPNIICNLLNVAKICVRVFREYSAQWFLRLVCWFSYSPLFAPTLSLGCIVGWHNVNDWWDIRRNLSLIVQFVSKPGYNDLVRATTDVTDCQESITNVQVPLKHFFGMTFFLVPYFSPWNAPKSNRKIVATYEQMYEWSCNTRTF